MSLPIKNAYINTKYEISNLDAECTRNKYRSNANSIVKYLRLHLGHLFVSFF